MKKYSSYKNIKSPNQLTTYVLKQPQTPVHSASYRKLTAIDISNQRPHEKAEIYPMSAKYLNYANITTTNASRKKMFSSKNIETPNRQLTLTKQDQVTPNMPQGYGNIRSKITDLESRLNQIKRNYDITYNNRKRTQKEKSSKNFKQNDISLIENAKNLRNTPQMYVNSQQNKENELPKEKKTQSKLLLERYQANKKLKTGASVSSTNLLQINQNSQLQRQMQQFSNKSPLNPKNIINANNSSSSKKTEPLMICNVNPINRSQLNINSPKATIQKRIIQPKSQQNDQYLKQFVTSFPCENKVPLSHSTSQTNLYKPHNKLSANYSNSQSRNQYYVTAVLNAFESKNPTSFQNLAKTHLTTSLDILTYIKNTKKQAPFKFDCKKLPSPKQNRQTIIFDLDQTLIHCNQNLTLPHDIALPIKFPNGAILKAGINIRPYAQQCLRQLSKHFELIVFTASHECYGNVIVDHLDPKKQFISYRYFRDSCFKTDEGFYVKDLRVVDRDLSKVLLIDNAAYSYCFQLGNGVPIIPFYDNKADLQLKSLVSYLKTFLGQNDVRVNNEDQMKLSQYTKFKDTKTLISKLYEESD